MTWTALYQGYDDDTLAALANVGLLRRAAKDVAAGGLEWLRQDADSGVVRVDGQQVTLDGKGPHTARCDCPAPGMCKHILGAVLWLRSQPNATEKIAATAQEISASALKDALNCDPAAVFKAAGAAAVRRAASTPIDTLEWHEQGAVLSLALPALGQSCRFVAGAGFDGMVSEVPTAQRKAVHLIALVALWRSHGIPFEWPAGSAPAPAAAEATLGPGEQALLPQVHSLLHELLRGGLAHVSRQTSAHLLALNMSARSEGLPRLAALLRNLGGMVDALEKRDHRVDEHDTLVLMAQIHALCTALAQAPASALPPLAGQLRRDFDSSAPTTLDLLPLGAHWWQTLGGARGLGLALWDVAGQRLLQASLARPDGSDPGFSRQSAWQTQTLWPGAGSAHTLCTGGLRLAQARISEDGRIALAGNTQAQPQPAWRADDARLATVGCTDWSALRQQLRAATGLATTAPDMLLLRPQATQAPVLREAQQRLDWQLQDGAGRWLTLSIPCGPEHSLRIQNLDRLTVRLSARSAPVLGVLVRVERRSAHTSLEPVAVLSQDGPLLQVVSLDYADEPVRPTPLTQRILRMFEARQKPAPLLPTPGLCQRLLAPVQAVLETQAATGRMQPTEHQRAALQQQQTALASVGLDSLARAVQTHLQAPAPHSLLQLTHLAHRASAMEGLALAE